MNRIIIALTIMSLQACAAIGDSKKSIGLEKAVYYYESTMRWADFAGANSLRRYEGPAVPGMNPKKLEHIKITGYETLNTIPSDDKSTVYIAVRISYYDEANMKEMTLTDNQVWHYDEEQNSWYISTPLPAFK